MNEKEFTKLTDDQKYEVLLTEAIRIAERSFGLYKYYLYQLHSFYVESRYHTMQLDIHGLRAFSSTKTLEPYLKQIDIRGLL
jgi:hypothetical protein